MPHIDANLTKSARPDVRESMDRPGFQWASRILTWVSGKPLPGQEPLFGSPWSQLATALVQLMIGFGAGALIVSSNRSRWIFLPICWLVTTSAARKIQVMIVHHCSHLRFCRSKLLNRVVGDALWTLIFVQDFTTYQRDHVTKHHGKDFATLNDPDVVTLSKLLRIEPGMTKQQLWKRLWMGLICPRLHFTFIRFRLRANFRSCPNYRKVLSVAYSTGLLALVALAGQWAVLFWAWLFPLILPYQISATLQFCSRHYWLQLKSTGENPKDHIARLTVGRFCGELAPAADLPGYNAIAAWTGWWFKMFTVHLFWRLFVLVNALPEHDWHHRYPQSWDWAVGPYVRQRDLNAGHPGWPPYEEVWGFLNSVDLAFDLFSKLPRPGERSCISADELEETVATM